MKIEIPAHQLKEVVAIRVYDSSLRIFDPTRSEDFKSTQKYTLRINVQELVPLLFPFSVENKIEEKFFAGVFSDLQRTGLFVY